MEIPDEKVLRDRIETGKKNHHRPGKHSMNGDQDRFFSRTCLVGMVLIVSALLSYSCTSFQVTRLGADYVKTTEVETQQTRLVHLLNRDVQSIYGYRILPTLLVEGMCRVTGLDPARAMFRYLVVVRILIFAACFYLFTRFGLSLPEALFGVFYLYYATNISFYNEGLNLYEPLNLLFYLVFFTLVVEEKDTLLLPLVVLASLNKETSVLMPVLYLAYRWSPGHENFGSAIRTNGKKLGYAAAMLAASLAVYFAIRYGLSDNSLQTMARNAGRYRWGFEALRDNLTNKWVYLQLFLLFNVVAVLPLCFWSQKPAAWRRALVIFCPLHFACHLFASRVDEVRLFAVYLVLMLPLSIDTLNRWWARSGEGNEEDRS